jgi:hypothetical protein
MTSDAEPLNNRLGGVQAHSTKHVVSTVHFCYVLVCRCPADIDLCMAGHGQTTRKVAWDAFVFLSHLAAVRKTLPQERGSGIPTDRRYFEPIHNRT